MGAFEISKKDWKLFRERIGEWQERYMKELLKEYVDLLESDAPSSAKFWDLEKRIKVDKRKPGVSLSHKKNNVDFDLARLFHEGVIDLGDLDGFSDEMIERVRELLGLWQ